DPPGAVLLLPDDQRSRPDPYARRCGRPLRRQIAPDPYPTLSGCSPIAPAPAPSQYASHGLANHAKLERYPAARQNKWLAEYAARPVTRHHIPWQPRLARPEADPAPRQARRSAPTAPLGH